MSSGRKRPIALEDLLALKRAERPSPEFWADFDRQLREKQLAALVGKRPWWQEVSFAGLFAGLRRYHLPLGATAVAAITLVSFRLGQSEIAVVAEVATPVPAARAAMAVASEEAAPEVPASGSFESVSVVTNSTMAAVAPEAPADVAVASASESAAFGVSRFIPLLGAPAEDGTEFGLGAVSRIGESSRGSLVASDTVMYRTLLSSSSRFEDRVTPAAKLTVEPLHQITLPSERRGSRILTAMVSMASVENAMRTTERAASRLSEEQLYDQISRFGARGAGVNVKF